MARIEHEVEEAAARAGASSALLKAVLVVEDRARGSTTHRTLERLACSLIKMGWLHRDLSLGLGQVRLSTANQLSPERATASTIDCLRSDSGCAGVSAMVLAQAWPHREFPEDRDMLRRVIELYLFGRESGRKSPIIENYADWVYSLGHWWMSGSKG